MTAIRECDALVVGGGSAGIAAAVSAARAGAKVILIEKYGFLGGMATAGMVGTVCGLYLRGAAADKPEPVPGPFAHEWAERLGAASSTRPVDVAGAPPVLPFDVWAFQRLADRIVAETPGLQTVLHATLTSAQREGDRVVAVEALVWDRKVVYRPRCVVDATGCATATALAGGPVQEDGDRQCAAVVLSIEGVGDRFEAQAARLSLLREVARARHGGRLSPDCRAVSLVPASSWRDRISLKIGLPPLEEGRPLDMTALEMKSRRGVEELWRFLVERAGCERCRLGRVATQVGVRVERRAKGRRVLTESDVLECRKFPDGVACGAWPIEEWGGEDRPRMASLPEGDWYEIPLDCLRVEGLENVFVAGRCLSATARAMASARVIATAMNTGWAAGLAAASQALGGDESDAVKRLRPRQASP